MGRFGQLRGRAQQSGSKAQQGAQQAGDRAATKVLSNQSVKQAMNRADQHLAPMAHHESIANKGGTVAGFDEAERLMTEDPEVGDARRLSELESLLVRRLPKRKPEIRRGSVDLFNKIEFRLAAGIAKPPRRNFGGIRGMTLDKAFREAFDRRTAGYFKSMIRHHGVPSKAYQIMKVYGRVGYAIKPSQSEIKQQVSYILRDMTPAEATRTLADLRKLDPEREKERDEEGRRAAKLDDEGERHLATRYRVEDDRDQRVKVEGKGRKAKFSVEDKLEKIAKLPAKQGKTEALRGDDAAMNEWLDTWDGKLADAVFDAREKGAGKLDKVRLRKHRRINTNIVAAVQKVLVKIAKEELALGDGVVRRHLAVEANRTQFEAELKKSTSLDEGLRNMLRTAVTTEHPTRLLRSNALEELKGDSPTGETAEERLVRLKGERKEQAAQIASVGILQAILADGNAQGDSLRVVGDLEHLVKKMQPEARNMLVAARLGDDEREQYLSPSAPAVVKQEMFERAWTSGGLRDEINAVLSSTDAKQAGDGNTKAQPTAPEREIDKTMVRIHSLLRFSGDAGPNYSALVELSQDAFGTKVSTRTYGTRIWEIVLRSKGADLYQIRNDPQLLLRLRKLVKRDLTKPSTTNWDKTVDLLRLPLALKLRGNDVAPTVADLRITNHDEDGSDLDAGASTAQAYEATENWLEFDASYWRAHLHRVMKHHDPSRSDAFSVISRAQTAADRLDRVRGQGEGAAMLRELHGLLTPAEQEKMKEKVPAAHAALVQGARLGATTRVETAAGWTFKGHQTPIGRKKSAIVGSFEDLSGAELLREWSNIEDLKMYHRHLESLREEREQLIAAGGDETRIEMLAQGMDLWSSQIATFWPSVNRSKLRLLEKHLSGGSRTEVLGMLCARLSRAMTSDPVFIEAAQAANLEADDYDAERLMFAHQVNRRRQLDTGLQYGGKSKLDVVRGARKLRNPMALMKFAERGGNSKINKSASQARKGVNTEYVAKMSNAHRKLAGVEGGRGSAEEKATRATELRERAAAQLGRVREEDDRRSDVFEAQRKNTLKVAEYVSKAVFLAIVGALTFGQGTAAVMAGMFLAAMAKEASKAVANWVVLGDAYEKSGLAKALVIGAITGTAKVATMGILDAIDAASMAVDFSPEATEHHLTAASGWGEIAKNQAVRGAVRSAVGDLTKNTAKYAMDVERPFKDMHKNLDAFIATQVSSIVGRQLAFIAAGMASKAGAELSSLVAPKGAAGPGRSGQAGHEAQHAVAGGLEAGLARGGKLAGKAAKKGVAAGMTAVWGKYPTAFKQLKKTLVNTSPDELRKAIIEEEELDEDFVIPDGFDVFQALEDIEAGRMAPTDLEPAQRDAIRRLLLISASIGMEV